MNEYYGAVNDYRGYLMHYGVKGMHWGVRRYQNTDGSLTSLGRQHYGYSSNRRGEGGMMNDIKRGGRKAFDYAKKHPEVSIPAATAAVAAIGKGVHSISRRIKKQKEEHKRNKTTYDHSTNQRIELKRKLTQKEKLELADRMKKGEKRTEALRNMNLVRDSKASGMLDFMKKNHKDTDKYKNASLSIEDLNKKLLNANANSMDIWKQLNKKSSGSPKEETKKQRALNWIKKHPAETILFTALGAVGVKRVIDLAYMGKQTYNTVKNWDKIMNTINDMEDDMQEYIRSSLNQQ